jgi:hypothetical protein
MFHDFRYPAILAASTRAAWQIDDVIGPGAELDFSRPFMPENLARTAGLEMLSDGERLTLNQIRAHDYLSLFGLVEEFILPFVLDHARPQLSGDDDRVRALLQFASEEAKHIQLFKRFHEAFTRGFGVECAVIGPPQAVAEEVLRHDPLSVALVILMIEWMTQSHYLDSVRDDADLDPLFANLLRCHWIEEAQHAKIDTLMVEALADGRSEAEIDVALDGFVEIGTYLDEGLRQQACFNLDALERASGRRFAGAERRAIMDQQHQALRWTYLGSGMLHENFRASLQAMSPVAFKRVEAAAPIFC